MNINVEITAFGLDYNVDTDEVDTSIDERKISSRDGTAQILVSPEEITITNKSNGIIVNQYGTTIDGLIHLGKEPGDIRISGFWVLNNELLTTLPSTTYTPISVLKYKEPPYIKWAQRMFKIVSKLGS